MKIKLRMTGRHSADVLVNGKKFGTASDCDGRWIIQQDNDPRAWDDLETEGHPLTGSYPAKTGADLAFAIRECVDGVDFVSITPY